MSVSSSVNLMMLPTGSRSVSARGLSAGPHSCSVMRSTEGRHDKMTEENRESVSAMD